MKGKNQIMILVDEFLALHGMVTNRLLQIILVVVAVVAHVAFIMASWWFRETSYPFDATPCRSTNAFKGGGCWGHIHHGRGVVCLTQSSLDVCNNKMGSRGNKDVCRRNPLLTSMCCRL